MRKDGVTINVVLFFCTKTAQANFLKLTVIYAGARDSAFRFFCQKTAVFQAVFKNFSFPA